MSWLWKILTKPKKLEMYLRTVVNVMAIIRAHVILWMVDSRIMTELINTIPSIRFLEFHNSKNATFQLINTNRIEIKYILSINLEFTTEGKKGYTKEIYLYLLYSTMSGSHIVLHGILIFVKPLYSAGSHTSFWSCHAWWA